MKLELRREGLLCWLSSLGSIAIAITQSDLYIYIYPPVLAPHNNNNF